MRFLHLALWTVLLYVTGTAALTSTIPSGWSLQGCLADDLSAGKALIAVSQTSNTKNNTIGACLNVCQAAGYTYGGPEGGSSCYCGFSLANGATASYVSSSYCSTACSNTTVTETCGGTNYLQLYMSSTNTEVWDTMPSPYSYIGCRQFTSSPTVTYSFSSSVMTQSLCVYTCKQKGYGLVGVLNANTCYCATTTAGGGFTQVSDWNCDLACPGATNHTACGGGASGMVSFFANTTVVPGAGTSTTTSCTPTTTSTTSASTATASGSSAKKRRALQQKRANLVCETGHTQCRLPDGRGGYGYRCLETNTDLFSCGGCPFEDPNFPGLVPLGYDCSGIPHSTHLSCDYGRCNVHACAKGWQVGPDRRSCVRPDKAISLFPQREGVMAPWSVKMGFD